jgi:hypothetical protein
MSQAFPASDRVVAAWFTGNLIIPDGSKTSHVDMGYGSQYERYIVIRVDAGVAGLPRRLNTREFAELRRSQFDAFKKTEQYREAVTKADGDSPMSPADMERFIFHYSSLWRRLHGTYLPMNRVI